MSEYEYNKPSTSELFLKIIFHKEGIKNELNIGIEEVTIEVLKELLMLMTE